MSLRRPLAAALAWAAVAAGAFATPACAKPAGPSWSPAGPRTPEALVARVLRSYPHDRDAFTQGLLWFDGRLYESTGLAGRSTLRRVELESGRIEREVRLEAPLFGEGLARVGAELVQLTWQDGRALVWDLGSFTRRREHTYPGEGWGLCHDGKRLVMSDGSDRLTFREPRTFASQGELRVVRAGQPARALNELECVDGAIYANVWQTQEILRIDARSGEVTAVVDAGHLLAADERAGADVLNGIAHVPERGTFLVTGKLWPRVFEVRFEPRAAKPH